MNSLGLRADVVYSAVMMLARWTPYLESEMLGLASLVGPGSVCLDAGAAAGLYSFVLSRLVGPSGQVHSIEPLSFAHPLWRRVLRTADCLNVSHHAVAVSAEPGNGMMSVPYRRMPVTGRSFLTAKTTGLGPNAEFTRHEEVPVPIDTIDALIERTGLTRLDFIKIDVEGAELQVLRGGQRTLREFRPAMLLEIEARHTARYEYTTSDVVDWLQQRGYRMYAWQDGWQETGQVVPHQRNYLFRPDRTA
jgi:FkbM family methyltransferase